jgi:uncharacterized protein YnzC (UPF0291/DUF896 family)
MQFKRVGGRIQVLGYAGYDKEKKRAKVEYLGSMDAYTLNFELSDVLNRSLTDSEASDVQSYIQAERQSREKTSRQSAILDADSRLHRLTDCIHDKGNDITPEKAAQIWAALEQVEAALADRGFKRRRGRPRTKFNTQQQQMPV